MKRTEIANLQFCSELDEVWLEMDACWLWRNAIDRFESTLGKIHDRTHLSSKILILYIVRLCIRKNMTFVFHKKSLLDE